MGESRLKVYVQKYVADYPTSLIGPFQSRAQAGLFIDRALVEEDAFQTTRDLRNMTWYRDVRYEVLESNKPM